MRLIRRLLLLAIVGVAGVAAYAYWSDNGSVLREKAAGLAAQTAKREAGKIASKAADTASDAADKLGDRVADGALTAKIKSKMALDDHVSSLADLCFQRRIFPQAPHQYTGAAINETFREPLVQRIRQFILNCTCSPLPMFRVSQPVGTICRKCPGPDLRDAR